MQRRSMRDLFHLVNKVLLKDQHLVSFSPDTPISEALDVMKKRNFSQIPVLQGDEVLGVFSYRSFSQGITQLPEKERDPMLLTVEEFLEDLTFVHITDKLISILSEFDRKDAVLVGLPNRLRGIITSMDVLHYFYNVASPFFLLGVIELSIRELIRAYVKENELKDCIDRSLRKIYEESKRKVPTNLEEMTLSDYVMLLRFRGTWDKFKPAFGNSSTIVYARLDFLPKLRNDIFHFRRDITIQENERLRDTRDWLLKRVVKYEAIMEGDRHD